MDEKISLVLVDDHELVLNGLRKMFDAYPSTEVVGVASDSATAMSLVERMKPTVLLLDVSISGSPVTETVRVIRSSSPQTRIIVLSIQDDSRLLAELLRLGISGYLLKSASWEELLAAVRHAGVHDRLLFSVSRRSIQELGEAAVSEVRDPTRLSHREIQVMMFTSVGLSNLQIANKLGLTEPTVKRHLHNIFGKLGAVSRLDAVNRAKEQGLLPSTPPDLRHTDGDRSGLCEPEGAAMSACDGQPKRLQAALASPVGTP